MSFVQDLIFGSISAIVGKTVMAPVERIKLLLQLQDASTQIAQDQKYKGIVDCCTRVYQEQGFLSFWRGNLSNVLRYFPSQASTLAINDYLQRTVKKQDPQTDFQTFLIRNVTIGGITGASTLFISYPFDVIRTRLGADVGGKNQPRLFSGSLDFTKQIWRKEGIQGFYSGALITLPGIFFYRGCYLGLFETGKVIINEKSLFQKFLLAQFSTITGVILIYPIDTIRRRLMMQGGREDVLYKNTRDCIRQIWQKEGLKGFYKGNLVNLIRVQGPALILVAYDELKKFR